MSTRPLANERSGFTNASNITADIVPLYVYILLKCCYIRECCNKSDTVIIKLYLFIFVETPRKFIIAELSIRQPRTQALSSGLSIRTLGSS